MYDERYATTRRLTIEKPICFDAPVDGVSTLLKTPDTDQKIAEGGLRLQGLYKTHSENRPLITVITVVYNGADYLEDTIKSVIGQTYDHVEYIIVDGGSKDGTLEIIRQYEHAIDYWVSEPDKGMYDGLAKGFQTASGTLICYLNAGDFYLKETLLTVSEIYKDTGFIWFTGLRSVCNERNVITGVDLPFRYKKELIRKGFYGKLLPFIQQESTFWHKKMLADLDFDAFRTLKLAGDYFLWFSFSKKSDLVVVKAQLGVFKIHGGQLSESLDCYWREVNSFKERSKTWTLFSYIHELFFWVLSPGVRKYFFKIWCYYDSILNKWIVK